MIEPGADPNAIRIALKGGGALKLSSQGDLVLTAEGKEIRFLKPRLYQELRGKNHDVAGRYVLRGARQVGFRVASYDTSLPLMIDPILSYSTYLAAPAMTRRTASPPILSATSTWQGSPSRATSQSRRDPFN